MHGGFDTLPKQHPLERIPASFQLGLRWYAFYTKPQAEKTAGADIRDMGYDVLVPFEKRIQRRPGRKPRPCEAALFPRYGFVRFEINDDTWGAILDAEGVVDLIRTSGIPRSVPDSVIDGLRLAESMGLLNRTMPAKVGQMAELFEGPFTGFVGKIIRARSDDRVDLMFKLLGAERVVTAPISTLREA